MPRDDEKESRQTRERDREVRQWEVRHGKSARERDRENETVSDKESQTTSVRQRQLESKRRDKCTQREGESVREAARVKERTSERPGDDA